VFSVEIRAVINTFSLSRNTRYAAYLVFKMIDDYGFENEPMDLSIDVEGGHSSTKSVCLDPNASHNKERTCSRNHSYKRRTVCKCPGPRWRPFPNVIGLQRPTMRSDGWLEIEMGEFFNSRLEGEEVQMSVVEELESGNKKGNFFLEGIEVRPKEEN
jgi:hypothetical protein